MPSNPSAGSQRRRYGGIVYNVRRAIRHSSVAPRRRRATDDSVEDLVNDQYDNNVEEDQNVLADFDTKSQKEVDQDVEDLLSDL